MNKFERKLKEVTAQTTASLLDKLKAWKKDWKNGSLMGGGCFINITTLGGNHGFEAFLDGEAFDKFVRPAIQQAMEMSLQKKKGFIDYESELIEKELHYPEEQPKKTTNKKKKRNHKETSA